MKTAPPPGSGIDGYIAGFPPDVQAILERIRVTIRDAAPGAREAVKYGLPTFVLGGNLVHFGAFKRHIGVYLTPAGIEAFEDDLSSYRSAKGSVQFPLDKPIPYDLIRRIVELRVEQVGAPTPSE